MKKTKLSSIALLILLTLTACGNQNDPSKANAPKTIAPIKLPPDTSNTDILGRLEIATGISWEDGRMDGQFPEGFVQRIISGYQFVEECNIDVVVFSSDALAKKSKSDISSWGWTSLWQFEDQASGYGIYLGEREGEQPCTAKAASAFNYALTR